MFLEQTPPLFLNRLKSFHLFSATLIYWYLTINPHSSIIRFLCFYLFLLVYGSIFLLMWRLFIFICSFQNHVSAGTDGASNFSSVTWRWNSLLRWVHSPLRSFTSKFTTKLSNFTSNGLILLFKFMHIFMKWSHKFD